MVGLCAHLLPVECLSAPRRSHDIIDIAKKRCDCSWSLLWLPCHICPKDSECGLMGELLRHAGDVYAVFLLSLLALPVIPLNYLLVHLDLAPLSLGYVFPCNLFCLLLFSCYLRPNGHLCRIAVSDSDSEATQCEVSD
ncbi:unnamed protein product [Cladocopium goreaui]|uniref:Uncharacterized protein n=1 Tax=Cladocopium goreaui TaxID=2562237 RepID=A0A9P1C5G8_9DINO|nr:unnamed protein product [Cladocopium goreaui]